MGNKKNDFKQALKRTREGKRHEMETIEGGYYFSPIKYSVEGSDAINAAMMKNKDILSGEALKKLKTITKDKDIKAFNSGDLMNQLSDEEFAELFQGIKTTSIETLDLNRAKLKYGIGPNNFGAGVSPEGALLKGGVPDAFVDDLLMNAEITAEIVGAITIWNSPLAKTQQ